MIGGVGLVGDPRQQGYSILSADGHADPEGQRAYFGSIYQPGVPLAAPIVGIAATPGGSGYWLANSPATLATDRGQMVEDRYSAISLTTVDDGPLGALYGFDSLCTESGDGHCGAVLLFLDHGLVASTARGAGVATAPGPAVLATLRSITGGGVGTLRASYPSYRPGAALCCATGSPDVYLYHRGPGGLSFTGSPPKPPDSLTG
jgi:hypothetical protein